LSFFKAIGALKGTDREGWKRAGIEEPESVAEHSYRCALMGLLLGKKLELDTCRLVELLLIHDLAEVKTGDITPYDGFTEGEKREMEREALETMCDHLAEPDRIKILKLWDEFETGESDEAKVARDIDVMERILQALEYGKKEKYDSKDLSEFIVQGKEEIETSKIQELVDIVSNKG